MTGTDVAPSVAPWRLITVLVVATDVGLNGPNHERATDDA